MKLNESWVDFALNLATGVGLGMLIACFYYEGFPKPKPSPSFCEHCGQKLPEKVTK